MMLSPSTALCPDFLISSRMIGPIAPMMPSPPFTPEHVAVIE
jgi:hypothetical protein